MIDSTLIHKVFDALKKRHVTIATAESCTGGLLAHTLTNISGSSKYFECGVISYSDNAKKQLLGVPERLLKQYGAVSKEVAAAMAKGIRQHAQVTYGLATTGIAGPTGGTKEKPIGLVYIALSSMKTIIVKQNIFSGDRLANKESTCTATLKLLLETLSKDTS